MALFAKKVKKLATFQFLNIKLLLNGRGFSKFKKTYRLKGELGRGGFGIVYRAVRISDDTPVAVKFIERRHVREWAKLNDERVPMEISMLARCVNIPGVIKLIDWYSMPEGFLIVMQRPYPCIDLFDFIKAQGVLDENLARFLFRQVVETIIQCMRHKVLHRDIKDENVVIDLLNGETRLIDFGAATPLKKTHYTDFQGTRLYCPPEWFLHALYLGEEAAVWSLGVLLYNMLNGRLPFRNEKDICTSHLLGPLPFHGSLSDESKDLMERCLCFDPFTRCSLADIMSHRWTRTNITADWFTLTAISANNSKKHAQLKSNPPNNCTFRQTQQHSESDSNDGSDTADSANCSHTSSMCSALSVHYDGSDKNNIDAESKRITVGKKHILEHVNRQAKTSILEAPTPKQLAVAVIKGTQPRKSTHHHLSKTNSFNRTSMMGGGSSSNVETKKRDDNKKKSLIDSGRSSAISSFGITMNGATNV